MPDSIALLESDGTIRMVNQAWREFADANDLRSPDYCVNTNYIDTCSSAGGLFADDAHDIAVALRELASGQRQEVLFDYTCHSPTQARWLQMRAAPVLCEPPMLIVIHRRIAPPAPATQEEINERFKAVSPREFDVLKLLVQGQSTKQVAASLHIGARTAEKHRQMIMRKTQAANIAELVLLVAIGDIVPLSLPHSVDGLDTDNPCP